MKHPQLLTEQQIVDRASGRIPWSAEAERALRRRITRTWTEMWISFLAALFFGCLAFLVHRSVLLLLAAFFFGYGVTQLYLVALLRETLGEEMRRGIMRGEFFEGSGMLANKPRSTERLTPWMQHPAIEIAFNCSCGSRHYWAEWDGAQWFPNVLACVEELDDAPAVSIDPGGGRWVILCPCGLGHFKLKGPEAPEARRGELKA